VVGAGQPDDQAGRGGEERGVEVQAGVLGEEFAVQAGDAAAFGGEASFQVGLVGVQSAGPGPVLAEGVLPVRGARVAQGGVEAPAQVAGDRPA
jgi:hypothetical protein